MIDIVYYPEYLNEELLGVGTSEGKFIPADISNSDYQKYLRWAEENNG